MIDPTAVAVVCPGCLQGLDQTVHHDTGRAPEPGLVFAGGEWTHQACLDAELAATRPSVPGAYTLGVFWRSLQLIWAHRP